MRTAEVLRKTRETDITARLSLDGGEVSVQTGVGFFDHMLTAFAVHGGFGLTLSCKGDLEVDCHHTVEDTGLVLGQAFAEALGGKAGIARYGSFFVPMDEALGFCAVDVSGRPFLVFEAQLPEARVGDFDACMAKEFFRAFSSRAGVTLHLRAPYGDNTHHILEALFKAFGHALAGACAQTAGGTLSTKGALD
ncbi:MAG TPA: imidazoleglycerol-phosphate dehydratase HisB [Candidatus Fimenecus excrementigallinarum]|uniref:Imidazoleglycerol-phosphate dehydratase n=1 Tax=Candidatus Fimenecus excrementigallinarum TaxID=2840816 RepID=A0A9D1IHZ0_9FIRM|nr:imidazoleglycerol-phosphate dehydratase HisB [Candidatus Fimenecus excrementigallinarum]